MVHD